MNEEEEVLVCRGCGEKITGSPVMSDWVFFCNQFCKREHFAAKLEELRNKIRGIRYDSPELVRISLEIYKIEQQK